MADEEVFEALPVYVSDTEENGQEATSANNTGSSQPTDGANATHGAAAAQGSAANAQVPVAEVHQVQAPEAEVLQVASSEEEIGSVPIVPQTANVADAPIDDPAGVIAAQSGAAQVMGAEDEGDGDELTAPQLSVTDMSAPVARAERICVMINDPETFPDTYPILDEVKGLAKDFEKEAPACLPISRVLNWVVKEA